MRDPAIMLWPDVFAPRSMSVTIDRPLFKGPKPLDGREQVVASSAGGWLITYDGVPVYREKYRQFRPIWTAIAAYARPIYVKPDYTDQQLARRNNISATSTTFATDNTTFSDGTSFTQSTGDCILSADAVRGATTISVTNSTVSPVEVGDYFEINGRLHLVNMIDGTSWSIWPPLRKSYTAGTILEIDDPRLVVYLTPESRGTVMGTEVRAISFMTVDFIEANW